MPLCLSAGAAATVLALHSFTLAWTHSIEKIRWEEDWRLEGGKLHLVAARIRGSGAGMEPPPEAVLHHGIWHYRPAIPPLAELLLAHSSAVADYELCSEASCRALGEHLPEPAEQAPFRLTACP